MDSPRRYPVPTTEFSCDVCSRTFLRRTKAQRICRSSECKRVQVNAMSLKSWHKRKGSK